MTEKVVILDNIRSAHNVGSIFRTSDGAGVVHIYVCGYTPAPIDRFGRTVAEIKKTSLGASESVPWTAVSEADIASLAARLKAEGCSIVVVEQAEGSVLLNDFSVPEKVVYVLGNEIDGVSPTWLAVADVVVEIPMQGMKESLNVSVCAGIVLFHR
jgi:23S rRNA (guanosine2251-2'-O)-methyltransferase